MVFKPINLARQSFVKTFTHGYAQSLVAASQSSSASQNTHFHTLVGNNFVNYFKTGPSSQFKDGQFVAAGSSKTGTATKSGKPDASPGDSGLDAYYAAWQTHQKSEEKETHEVQFAKRIGWKPPTTIPDKAKEPANNLDADADAELNVVERRPTLTRSKSTTALDTQIVAKDATSDIVFEIESSVARLPVVTSQDALAVATVSQLIPSDVVAKASSPVEETLSRVPSIFDDSVSIGSTKATSIAESDAYTDHLATLAEHQRYGEIPAVFESMLNAGITPSSSAYNALLLAAINLPRGRHQVVPRALDVYSDMLRRRVIPDTSTYAILIELLAARALDLNAMTQDLAERQTRYGSTQKGFLFQSDELDLKIATEDDSLSTAIRLFDTAAALSTKHVFFSETYRLLICACAETARIGDMVRIYADMESRKIIPPTAVFAPMIQAFAANGDLRSSVECYDEYKALAIAHDNGLINVVRKDEEIYASLVRAYSTCDRMIGGLKFLSKIEDAFAGSNRLTTMRNAVALHSLYPEWLRDDRHSDAVAYAMEKLGVEAHVQALAAICIDAADKGMKDVATETFKLIKADLAEPAVAMLAMHVRLGDMVEAEQIWQIIKTLKPSIDFIEPTTMFAVALIKSGNVQGGLTACLDMFASIRQDATQAEVVDRIDEAIEIVSSQVFDITITPPTSATLDVLRLMIDNGGLLAPVAHRSLASLGPDAISSLPPQEIDIVTQVQSGMLRLNNQQDSSHAARFTHLVSLISTHGLPISQRSYRAIEEALPILGSSDLNAQWQRFLSPPIQSVVPARSSQPGFDDAYDPYASSTDFKGSVVIADELDKPQRRNRSPLNEALARFKNIRRAGRHPRYITYAKLISGAAKENRLSVAKDVLSMAQQDVPLVSGSAVVRTGWISILDAMVGACLTAGQRESASQYHQDLLAIGAAPSANTFGLYITTLKESTKTIDEASEAVKIFHRAKTEGVEPSSFLYNALIGKLGKARRIDDCLYYFAEMRNLGIRPTSVTYGTIVNALCRVSDDRFAEELFEEMESMPNYKPRPAPYNSLMQYFLVTKRDRSKVLAYYERMKANNIAPTMHTYKLLIDTHATLDPIDLSAAESVIHSIRAAGMQPEAVHYAALIHANGCVRHDLPAARAVFDAIPDRTQAHPAIYQALFESFVAAHDVSATDLLLTRMRAAGVPLTPYIANTLIHGWAAAGALPKAVAIFAQLGREGREPSTYEAMVRAHLAGGQHGDAMLVVGEALRRGYPTAVAGKICELVGGGPAMASF